ncbi:hypothetical protein CspHIS471_0302890 [Cutaneotrichosporon sp. HIS471]|nr:hypothetical protein CspHIS471_0302890 [Cutaneotrichosporon sp. HIS471]
MSSYPARPSSRTQGPQPNLPPLNTSRHNPSGPKRPVPTWPLTPFNPSRRPSTSKTNDATLNRREFPSLQHDGVENTGDVVNRPVRKNGRATGGAISGTLRSVSGRTRSFANPPPPNRRIEESEAAPPVKRRIEDSDDVRPSKRRSTNPLFDDSEYSDSESSDSDYDAEGASSTIQNGKPIQKPNAKSTRRGTKSKQTARGTSRTERSVRENEMRRKQVELRVAQFRAGRMYCRHPSHPLYDPRTHFSPQAYASLKLDQNGVDALGPVAEKLMWDGFTDLERRMLAAQVDRDFVKGVRLMWIINYTDFTGGIRPLAQQCGRCVRIQYPCMIVHSGKTRLCMGCYISKGHCVCATEDPKCTSSEPWKDFRLWVHRAFGFEGVGDHLGPIEWEAHLPPVPLVNPLAASIASKEGQNANQQAAKHAAEGDTPNGIVDEVTSKLAEVEVSPKPGAPTTKPAKRKGSDTGEGAATVRGKNFPQQTIAPSGSTSDSAGQRAPPFRSESTTPSITLRIPARQSPAQSRQNTNASVCESLGLPTAANVLESAAPASSNASETHTDLGRRTRSRIRRVPVKDFTNADTLAQFGLPTEARRVGEPVQVCNAGETEVIDESADKSVSDGGSGSDDDGMSDEDDEQMDVEELENNRYSTARICNPPPAPRDPSLRTRHAVTRALLAGNLADPAYAAVWETVQAHVLVLARDIKLLIDPKHFAPPHLFVARNALEAPFLRYLLEKPYLTAWNAVKALWDGDYRPSIIGPLARRLASYGTIGPPLRFPSTPWTVGESYYAIVPGGVVVLLGSERLWGTLLVQGTSVKIFATKAWEKKFTRARITRFVKALGYGARSVVVSYKAPVEYGAEFALWAFEQLALNHEWKPRGIEEPFLLSLGRRHALVLANDQDIALGMAKKLIGNIELVTELVNRAGLK